MSVSCNQGFLQVAERGTSDLIPLLVAAGNGYCDILQLLVAYGAKVNIQVIVAYLHFSCK